MAKNIQSADFFSLPFSSYFSRRKRIVQCSRVVLIWASRLTWPTAQWYHVECRFSCWFLSQSRSKKNVRVWTGNLSSAVFSSLLFLTLHATSVLQRRSIRTTNVSSQYFSVGYWSQQQQRQPIPTQKRALLSTSTAASVSAPRKMWLCMSSILLGSNEYPPITSPVLTQHPEQINDFSQICVLFGFFSSRLSRATYRTMKRCQLQKKLTKRRRLLISASKQANRTKVFGHLFFNQKISGWLDQQEWNF